MGPLSVGAPAPDFSLPGRNGRTVSLRDYAGQNEVLVYFYPKDDTPGCTREACSLRDKWQDLKDAGIVVLGISRDDAESHAAFAGKYRLPFELLTDADHKVHEAYGAWGENASGGTGVLRKSFLVGKDGTIKHVFDKVETDRHADQVLEAAGYAAPEAEPVAVPVAAPAPAPAPVAAVAAPPAVEPTPARPEKAATPRVAPAKPAAPAMAAPKPAPKPAPKKKAPAMKAKAAPAKKAKAAPKKKAAKPAKKKAAARKPAKKAAKAAPRKKVAKKAVRKPARKAPKKSARKAAKPARKATRKTARKPAKPARKAAKKPAKGAKKRR